MFHAPMERHLPHPVEAIRQIAIFSVEHHISKQRMSDDHGIMTNHIHEWPDRQSIRLKGFDYGSTATYFITACIKDRQCVLGDMINGKIHLSAIGLIVADEWEKTGQIRQNVYMDDWVIMPNHFHGIIAIRQMNAGDPPDRPNQFRLRSNSLGSIMSQFKSITTKRIHASGFHDFAWQRNYYERIIRNDVALEQIRAYIKNNPLHWQCDRNHSSLPSPNTSSK